METSTSSNTPTIAGPSNNDEFLTPGERPSTRVQAATTDLELESQSARHGLRRTRTIFKVKRPLTRSERARTFTLSRFQHMNAVSISSEDVTTHYGEYRLFQDFLSSHSIALFVKQNSNTIFLHGLVTLCDQQGESVSEDPWICIFSLRSNDEIRRFDKVLSTPMAKAIYSPLQICYRSYPLEETVTSTPSTKSSHPRDAGSVLPRTDRQANQPTSHQPLQARSEPRQYFHVPYPRNDGYVGSEALFEALGALLAPRQTFDFQRRFVIQGVGGSGKTEFALEFAYRNRNRFWGVFWINGNTGAQARASFHDIAQLLNIEGDLKSILTQLSHFQDGKDFLLVFDDAGDILYSMDTYFPPGPKGTILITTRDHEDRGVGNVGPGYFEFNSLETSNAVRLFLEESCQPQPWDISTLEEARHIVESCGGLPLAIIQLARSRMDRREILRKLEEDDSAERVRDSSSPLRAPSFSVNGLFEDVFLRLSPSALRLLRVISFWHSHEIPAKMLRFAETDSHVGAAARKIPPKEDSVEFSWFIVLQSASHMPGSSEFNQFLALISSLTTDSSSTDVASNPISLALTELQSRVLIRYQAKDDTYLMHPLVQQMGRMFRYPLDAEPGYFEKMAARFVGRAITRPFWDRLHLQGPLEFEKELLPHMDHLMSNQQDNWSIQADNGDIFCMFAMGYFMCGNWRSAAILLKEVAGYCQRHLGDQSQTTRHTIRILTVAHFKLAGYIENTDVFPVSAIDGWRVDLNPYFRYVLREVQALGRQRWREKRYNEAQDIQEKVLKELQALDANDTDLDLLMTRHHLGSTLQAFMTREHLQQALDLHVKAIADSINTAEKNNGKLVSLRLDAQLDMCWASVLLDGSRTTEATNTLLDVTLDSTRTLGEQHRCMLTLSIFLSALGYATEAENVIREAIRTSSNTSGNLVDTGLRQALLACILFRMGRIEEAKETSRMVRVSTCENFFTENDIPPTLLLVPVALAIWALAFGDRVQGALLLTVLVRKLGRGFGARTTHPLIEDLLKANMGISYDMDSARTLPQSFEEVIRNLDLNFLALFLGHSSDTQTMHLDTDKLHQIMKMICPEKPTDGPSSASLRSYPDDAGSTISSRDSDSSGPTNPQYAESIFSAVMSEISMSSNSSLDYVVAARGQLVQLLLGDDEIQHLVRSALKDPKIGARRLARNFRRLLVEFSKDLLTQATSLAHKDAAKLIRTQSLQIAAMVNSNSLADLGSTEQEEAGLWAWLDDTAQSEGQQQVLSAYLQSLSDHTKNREAWDTIVQPHEGDVDTDYDNSSDNSSDEEPELDENPAQDDGKLSTRDLDEVKDFIRSGPPLVKFKERLRNFVSPTFARKDLEIEQAGDANLIEDIVGEEVVTNVCEGPIAPHGTFNPVVDEPTAPARMMPTAVGDEVTFQENISSATTIEKDITFSENSKGVGTLSPDVRGKGGVAPELEENTPSDFLPAKPRPPTYPATLPELLDSFVEKITGPGTEPPAPSGHSRIRWTCECGAQLFDDFIELEEGALKDLQATLQKRPNQGDDPDQGKEGPWHFFSTNSFKSGIGWLNQRASSFLSQRSDNSLPVYQANNPPIHLTTLDLLRLLFCIQAGETGLKLHQEKLTGISSDQEVLLFLRAEYYRRRNVTSWLTFRNVSTVSLARFMVDASSFAEVHKHAHFCHTADCVCLPPVEKIGTEYACRPAPQTKPKYYPAIGPRYLTHHFRHPDCLRPAQRFIYNQLPKRACGQLSASDDQMEFGWGVYFEEGWHWMSIYLIIVLLLVSGSLVFGVTWSVTKGDVQGGFAISSLWMTIGSLLLGYIAVRSVS